MAATKLTTLCLALFACRSAGALTEERRAGNRCPDQTYFDCQDGNCVKPIYECDIYPNCDDGHDEDHCPRDCSGPNQFQCKRDKDCIPNVYVCNGEEDCRDGTDETQNCPTDCSGPNQFRCTSVDVGKRGWCITEEERCDNVDNDCPNNEDESNCPDKTY